MTSAGPFHFFAASTGIRFGRVCDLRRADVVDGFVVIDRDKNGERVHSPLVGDLAKLVERRRKAAPFPASHLFPGPGVLGRDDVRKPGGNAHGLGEGMSCLDAAGVPFFLKSVDSAGPIFEAAQLMEASGVPHVLVYRRSAGSGWNWDVPDYDKPAYDAAVEHWQRHRAEFPPELEPYKHLIWIESINEVDKNRSEWLAEFSWHTAQIAMAEGFNYAAFGWSSGEPEPEHWQGPWMLQLLELASDEPTRVAIALHEYSYVLSGLTEQYPYLVGRFQKLYEIADSYGLRRPTVLVTEFGWTYQDVPGVGQAFDVDLPWAASLYAAHPEVQGAAIWYLGPGFGGIANQAQKYIAPMTEYALRNYFVIPKD